MPLKNAEGDEIKLTQVIRRAAAQNIFTLRQKYVIATERLFWLCRIDIYPNHSLNELNASTLSKETSQWKQDNLLELCWIMHMFRMVAPELT